MRWIRPFIERVGIALVALAAAAPSCGGFCTEVGCSDHLGLAFEAPLAAGAWEIDVLADGLHWVCQVEVPIVDSSTLGCSGTDVYVVAWSDGPDAPALARSIQLAWNPKEVEVVFRRDGDEVGRHLVRPDYEDHFPNGPECDEFPCRVALETVDPEGRS